MAILPNQLIQFPILLFFPMFLIIYLTGYFLIFKNWPPKLRPEASSCFISLFHGTPAAFLAIFSLLHSPLFQQPHNNNNNDDNNSVWSHRNGVYFSPNTQLQNMVLEYSIAYFIMDLTHYLIFNPSDILFIGHHLATLFVFITCRFYVNHGAFSILVLLILAEITSFMQNIWTLASARRVELEFADKVYNFLSPPFYVVYTIARVILGPLFVYKMGCSFIRGESEGVIPNWILVSWIGVIVTAICVSILWIWNLWVDLFREYSCSSSGSFGVGKKIQ